MKKNILKLGVLSGVLCLTLATSCIEEEPVEETTIVTDDNTDDEFTVWSGESITFTKETATDANLEVNQDRITDNVWLTRSSETGDILFNAAVETKVDDARTTPTGTEWALGSVEDLGVQDALTFGTFKEVSGSLRAIAGKSFVVHLLEEDVYLSLTFISWDNGSRNGDGGSGGGFSYSRSTPTIVE